MKKKHMDGSYRTKVSLKEGIRRTIQWYEDHGWLSGFFRERGDRYEDTWNFGYECVWWRNAY